MRGGEVLRREVAHRMLQRQRTSCSPIGDNYIRDQYLAGSTCIMHDMGTIDTLIEC